MLGIGLIAALCVCGNQLPSLVGGEKKPKPEVIEGKAQPYKTAVGINFGKELGLAFPSLATLGGRIEQARQLPDPVTLAVASRELAAAEQASGKEGSLKSAELSSEAAALAKARSNPKEMKAVAALLGDKGKDLVAAATKAEEWLAKLKKDRESGAKERGLRGTLHVDSRYAGWINVYVNGRNVGSIPPRGDIYPYINDNPWETTILFARSDDGRTWRAELTGTWKGYTWVLH